MKIAIVDNIVLTKSDSIASGNAHHAGPLHVQYIGMVVSIYPTLIKSLKYREFVYLF